MLKKSMNASSLLLIAATLVGCAGPGSDLEMDDAAESPGLALDDAAIEGEAADPAAELAAGSSTQLATCAWDSCNGKDPVTEGCTATAQMNREAWITDGGPNYIGKVEGWSSTACASQWTKVISYSGGGKMRAYQDYDPGSIAFSISNRASGVPVTELRSKMVSASFFTKACGKLDGDASVEKCTLAY